MTSILHDYNFCPLCIIYPILGLPKIDILRDMAASNVFEMVFSHSIYSLSFQLSFLLVQIYCFETPEHLWVTKGESGGPLDQENQTRLFNIVKEKINFTFSILCTRNCYIDTSGSTKSRFCKLVNLRKFNCVHSRSAFLMQVSSLVRMSG